MPRPVRIWQKKFWGKKFTAKQKRRPTYGAAHFMVLCYNKASKGARDLHRLAGRIGKQVQNLCGTAAVMVEPGPNLMSLHIVREDAGPGGDARAGRPAFGFILPGAARQTAAVPGAGPVLRTDQTLARKTKVHRVLMGALFQYGSARLLGPGRTFSFYGAVVGGLQRIQKESFL